MQRSDPTGSANAPNLRRPRSPRPRRTPVTRELWSVSSGSARSGYRWLARTPAGRLMANVLASVAAYETEVRAERVKAGQAAARARGQHLGRRPGTTPRSGVDLVLG
jgi:hypothetical protein